MPDNSVFIRNCGHDYLLLTEVSVYYWASIITRRLNAGGVKVLTPPIPLIIRLFLLTPNLTSSLARCWHGLHLTACSMQRYLYHYQHNRLLSILVPGCLLPDLRFVANLQ